MGASTHAGNRQGGSARDNDVGVGFTGLRLTSSRRLDLRSAFQAGRDRRSEARPRSRVF